MSRSSSRAKDLAPQDIITVFAEAGHEVERRGTYWLTQCPVHDDHRPSLKVDHGDKVPTVVTCYAGCASADIWHWIEEEVQGDGHHDVPDFAPTITMAPGRSLKLADYAAYLHVPTKFLQTMGLVEVDQGIAFPFGPFAQKLRVVSKDGKRSFRWNNGEANQFPLFPVPHDELPTEIWICEGETDGIVARYLGLEAFALTSGSSAAPKHLTVEHFAALKRWGVETVIFVPHTDEPGQKCTNLLTTSAQAAGLDVRWCVLEEDRENPFDVTLQPTDLHEWVLAQDTNTPIHLLRERCVTQVKFKNVEDGMEFRSHAQETINWVIPELIAVGDVIGIVAPPKNLKTYFALSLLHSLAACEPFLRRGSLTPSRPMRVMMVEEEGHKIHFARRMERVARSFDEDWVAPVTVRWSSGFILEEAAVDALIAEINFHEIDVIMLDPWQRITAGADESSASETAEMWDEIFRIRKETGCTVIIIHHMRKDAELTPDAIRGSSRFRGEVDASILLRYDPDAATLFLVVEGRDIPYAANDGAHPVKVIWEEEYEEVFALDGCEFEETVSISLKKGPVSDANRQKVLASLQDHGEYMTKKEIEDATGFSRDTVARHLKALCEDGDAATDPDATGPGKTARYRAV
jgi:hypothetical protein